MDLLQACCDSPQLLGAVLSSIQHVVIVMEDEGKILVANPIVEQMFGLTPQQLQGQNMSILFTPEDLPNLYPNLLHMARKDKSFEGELTLMRTGEARFFAFMVFRPYFDPIRNSRLIVTCIHDIDAQKNPEEGLRDTHYEDLVKIADGIAHELRNPLVGIGGAARRLYKACRNAHGYEKYCDRILDSVRRLEGLVENVEFFAHLPSPRLRKESIRELVHEALRPYLPQMEERNIEFTNTVEDVILHVDKGLIIKACSILVDNALDAIHDGGRIVVHSETTGNECKTYVTDTGAGIASEDLPYIFNPFFRTKPTGVGIDLAVVKRIMNSHGGRVEAESKQGEGTTFLLVFPVERRRPIRVSDLKAS
jgi:PAS domain S-box-containing protein